MDDWRRERPNTGGQMRSGQRRAATSDFVGPLEYLSAETALPQPTLERILYRRSRMTELRDADRIVTAMGREDVFYNGVLSVRPNPLASARAQAACCAGSLTGTVPPPAR